MDTTVDYPGPPELTLGVGQDAFTELHDGDAVPIATAPQGGNVVYGAVSGRYFDPREVELVFSIAPSQGAPSLRRVVTDLADADGGLSVGTSVGHLIFLLEEDRFAGQPCLWRVEAVDRDGRMVSDEKMVIPTSPL